MRIRRYDRDWATRPHSRRTPPGGAPWRFWTSYPKACRQIEQYLAAVETPEVNLHGCGDVVAAMIPHIDHARGGISYAKLYKALGGLPRPDVIVMLGVWHNIPGIRIAAGEDTVYYLADREYTTSFGLAPLAIPEMKQLGALFSEELYQSLGVEYYQDLLLRWACLHDQEHSLELPLPWIVHPYHLEEKGIPPVLPLLVGSLAWALQENKKPEHNDYFDSFFLALGSLLAELRQAGKRVLIVGSVDMSHKGLYFGDSERMCGSWESDIIRDDYQLLEHLKQGNRDSFFWHLARDNNWFGRDTFEVIYTILTAMDYAGIGVKGHLVDYRLNSWEAEDNIVSCAAMAFSEVV